MTNLQCVFLMGFALATAVAPASAVPITLSNPGFEDLVLAGPGDFSLGNVPGWTVAGTQVATFEPGPAQFPSGAPEGVNTVGIGNPIGEGSVTQATVATLQPNATYTLMVEIGERADIHPMTGYAIELLVGNTVLASSSDTDPASGQFLTDTLIHQTGDAASLVAAAGTPISIRLRSIGSGQTNFDNVRFDAEPVPEPASLAMVLVGLGTLIARRRWR